MLRLSAAGSPAGRDLPLIQHKGRAGTTCWTLWFYFLIFISENRPVRGSCVLASLKMWGFHLCRHAEKTRLCWGSWPNVESWWPRKSSLEAQCRPLRGWTTPASTTTSSTWWPIRWELISSSTAGSDCSWRWMFLGFVQCQFSVDCKTKV